MANRKTQKKKARQQAKKNKKWVAPKLTKDKGAPLPPLPDPEEVERFWNNDGH